MRDLPAMRAHRPMCRPGFVRAFVAVGVAVVVTVAVLDGVPHRAFDYGSHLVYCLKVGDYTRNSVSSFTLPDGSIGMVIT